MANEQSENLALRVGKPHKTNKSHSQSRKLSETDSQQDQVKHKKKSGGKKHLYKQTDLLSSTTQTASRRSQTENSEVFTVQGSGRSKKDYNTTEADSAQSVKKPVVKHNKTKHKQQEQEKVEPKKKRGTSRPRSRSRSLSVTRTEPTASTCNQDDASNTSAGVENTAVLQVHKQKLEHKLRALQQEGGALQQQHASLDQKIDSRKTRNMSERAKQKYFMQKTASRMDAEIQKIQNDLRNMEDARRKIREDIRNGIGPVSELQNHSEMLSKQLQQGHMMLKQLRYQRRQLQNPNAMMQQSRPPPPHSFMNSQDEPMPKKRSTKHSNSFRRSRKKKTQDPFMKEQARMQATALSLNPFMIRGDPGTMPFNMGGGGPPQNGPMMPPGAGPFPPAPPQGQFAPQQGPMGHGPMMGGGPGPGGPPPFQQHPGMMMGGGPMQMNGPGPGQGNGQPWR